MQSGNHFRFGDACNQGLFDCRSRCDTQRMAIQTSFAEKVTRFQNSYDRFLAPLGNDGELDLALLDVKNGVCRIALPEHNFILSIIVNGSPAIYLREKHFGIERELCFAFHCWPSRSRRVSFGVTVNASPKERSANRTVRSGSSTSRRSRVVSARSSGLGFAHGRFLRTL